MQSIPRRSLENDAHDSHTSTRQFHLEINRAGTESIDRMCGESRKNNDIDCISGECNEQTEQYPEGHSMPSSTLQHSSSNQDRNTETCPQVTGIELQTVSSYTLQNVSTNQQGYSEICNCSKGTDIEFQSAPSSTIQNASSDQQMHTDTCTFTCTQTSELEYQFPEALMDELIKLNESDDDQSDV